MASRLKDRVEKLEEKATRLKKRDATDDETFLYWLFYYMKYQRDPWPTGSPNPFFIRMLTEIKADTFIPLLQKYGLVPTEDTEEGRKWWAAVSEHKLTEPCPGHVGHHWNQEACTKRFEQK